nr:MAG TPA: hypothetical protein [Caudoviricetes sp.]
MMQLVFTAIQLDGSSDNKTDREFPIVLKGQRMP